MNAPRSVGDLNHLEYLIAELHGRYSIGYVAPVEDVVIAMASGHKKVMVTLVSRTGESIEELRQRLNAAVGEVLDGEEPINELADRGIQFTVTRRRMPRRPPPGNG